MTWETSTVTYINVGTQDAVWLDRSQIESVKTRDSGSVITMRSGATHAVMKTPREVMDLIAKNEDKP